MPAPAVYVLAILGTVGAVFAFKEFVYEPHIVPALERWKAEYDARREARRRRGAPIEVPMSERRHSETNDSPNDEDDSGNSASASGPSTWRSEFMRNGLLRRRGASAQPPVHATGRDVELESLVAPEVSAWRNATSNGAAQDVGQRSSANLLDQSSHSIDESIHAIPYPALSPTHAPHHVLFDSSMNSPLSTTPSSHASGLPSMPASPAPGTMYTGTLPSGTNSGTPERNASEEPQPPQPHLTHPSGPEPQVDSSRRATPSPPPIFVSSVPLVPSPPPARVPSPLTPPLSTSSSLLPSPPAPALIESANQQQDVLSPLQLSVLPPSPSSRASSPNLTPTSPEGPVSPISSLPAPVPVPATSDLQGFTDSHATPTANQFQHPSYSIQQPILSLSQSYPQELDYEQGLELLSPPSSRAESPFSMADYSPAANFRSFSPLGVNTNVRPESSLSPLSSVSASSAFSSVFSSPEMTHSPIRMGLGNESFDTLSPVMQARAFSGLGAADRAVTSPFADPVDSPRSLRASVSPQPSYSQTSSAQSTTYLSLSGSDDDESELYGPNTRADQSTDQGLGLTLFPTSVSASTPTASSAIQPRSPGAQTQIQNHPQSDSEFSDLDFLSDVAGTESEAESEEGWSVAGSEQGLNRASNANGAAALDRNETIRARGGAFGWRR
ncbi:unnamed protein product [Cyclocybe aegerita]|uniref:Uncharacterized protein n=1 Tax=Cyclocybe aegerita TaxID=1973307 RepID=A0A8S0WV47_CYCAE|nr:unnamed protein product [Cyclocybe aegerita]